jgi:osmotically-inducible protein OsmY
MVMSEPRLELKIGARVKATDGAFGHLRHVILSPLDRRVVALIIRHGVMPPRDVVVPIAEVADANEQGVWLRASRAELEARPAFDPAEYVELPNGDQGYDAGPALVAVHGGAGDTVARALVATHLGSDARIAHQGRLAGQAIALRRGQAVWCSDGRAGRVDLLLLDSAGQVRHFVIRKGLLLGRDIIVPIEWVRRIDERGVWLAVALAALDRLPRYRPDSEIAADVDQALLKDEIISAIDYDTIDVAVHDGVVRLDGYAATPVSKARAEAAAGDIPGVLRVENEIMTDGELVSAVTQAFAREPLLRGQRLSVHAEHGEVYLSGRVTSPEIRVAAEQIAAKVPRVRAVANEVLAPDVAGVEVLRALDLGIGQVVHATEMPVGKVERVIVSPQQRRATAFVAHGHFPDLARATPRMLPDEMPKQARRVVIPISAVREVTADGVQLRVSGMEAARYPEFAPANFVTPDAKWQPPPPFRPTDVLLDLGCAEARRQDLRPAPSGQALVGRGGLGGVLIWEYIDQGMPVHCRDGTVGTVDHVRVDSYHGAVSQIVVCAGPLLPKDTLIPLDWVRSIDAPGVFVNVGAAQLAALPAADPRAKDAARVEAL